MDILYLKVRVMRVQRNTKDIRGKDNILERQGGHIDDLVLHHTMR